MSKNLSADVEEDESVVGNLLSRLTGREGGEMLGVLTLQISEHPGISPASVTTLMARIWAGPVTAVL